jgi:WD40 repeat protein
MEYQLGHLSRFVVVVAWLPLGLLQPRRVLVAVIVSISGNTYGTPVCFTCANYATDTQPRFQPTSTGSLIAYLSTEVLQYESDRYRIKVFDRNTGKITTITNNWELSVTSISWSYDGSYILAEALAEARSVVFKVTLDGSITRLIGNHTNKAARSLPDGSILFSRQALTFPLTIYQWFPSNNKTIALTHFNCMAHAHTHPTRSRSLSVLCWNQVLISQISWLLGQVYSFQASRVLVFRCQWRQDSRLVSTTGAEHIAYVCHVAQYF